MALGSEVQSLPSNLSNFVVVDDDDPNSMFIEMYDELKKISKRNKEIKNKIDNLLNDNSKLGCENKTLLESLEVLKKEKDFSNLEFQKLVIESKNLCEKVLSLEKCMVDYNDLKKKEHKPSSTKWYLNSGCSRHMIGNASLTSELKEPKVASSLLEIRRNERSLI
ncbi:hypothetical protein M9H77_26321 [Catharanthus roseus]|uniref:Uncharacterized protein n=1 Tax=Catharanthus roseus TaxID=4058 RepID=A0ACC0AC02_CATRO|nr:hypothetical protein M9H77_26321 [Catharanthus roseus]